MDSLMGEGFMEAVSRNGMNWIGKIIAVLVILGVAAFGDVMYVRLMTSVLPSGPLLVLCYIGAFTSFFGTVYLLIGKTSLFTPGKQTVFAWVALGVELTMIAMNIILVFHGVGNDQFLSAWVWIAPATPVINMLFVAILFFLDEEQHERYEDKMLQTRQRKMDRHYQQTLYHSQMALKHRQLEYMTTQLGEAVNSPESQAFIEQTARDMNAKLLSSLAGRSYNAPRTPTVEAGKGSGSVQLAQTAMMAETGGVKSQPLRPFLDPAKQRRTARRARSKARKGKKPE